MNSTEIHLHWPLGSTQPSASVNVSFCRAMTADELRLFADVIEAIEAMRADVAASVTP